MILETLEEGDFGDSRSTESGRSMTCRFEGLYRRGNCRYILKILEILWALQISKIL